MLRRMKKGISAVAKKVKDYRKDKKRPVKVFGNCIHTSGRGILKRAKEEMSRLPTRLVCTSLRIQRC